MAEDLSITPTGYSKNQPKPRVKPLLSTINYRAKVLSVTLISRVVIPIVNLYAKQRLSLLGGVLLVGLLRPGGVVSAP